MHFSININKIKTWLLFIIAGLPGCCILIGNIKLRLSFVLTFLFLFFYTVFCYKKFIKEIFQAFGKNNGKTITCAIVCCFISGIYACFRYNYNFASCIYYFLLHGILQVCLPFYLAFCIAKNLSLTKVIRSYLIFLLCIFILGIINYIFLHSNISFFNTFFSNYIANTRILYVNTSDVISSWQRVASTFVEPSYFARFICLNLPIVYEFSKSNFKLFKNSIINYLIKKSFPFISLFLIVATKSPIFLVFGLVITVLYIMFTLRKKTILGGCLIFMLIVTGIILFSFMDEILLTYNITSLNRIVAVFNNLKSFEQFLIAESSLATRIIDLTNQYILFLQHPIFGVGFGNVPMLLADQFTKSPLPLTFEIASIIQAGGLHYNASILFSSLAGTGIITTMIWYVFFIQTLLYAIKDINFVNFEHRFFYKGMIFFMLIFLLITIYTSELSPQKIIVFGLVSGLHYKRKVNHGKN